RDCIRTGDRDYSRFAQERTFRYSLINQGFDFAQLTLDREIPEHIRMLVIADMRTAMPEDHLRHLENYVARGGNLLIAAEPGRQESMGPVAELFGVQLMDGRVVKPSENYPADMIFARPTAEAGELARQFGHMRN